MPCRARVLPVTPRVDTQYRLFSDFILALPKGVRWPLPEDYSIPEYPTLCEPCSYLILPSKRQAITPTCAKQRALQYAPIFAARLSCNPAYALSTFKAARKSQDFVDSQHGSSSRLEIDSRGVLVSTVNGCYTASKHTGTAETVF